MRSLWHRVLLVSFRSDLFSLRPVAKSLRSFRFCLQKDKSGEVKGSPTYYVKELNEGAPAETIKALRMALGVQPAIWYKQFKDLGGLRALGDNLYNDKKMPSEEAQMEVLRALKTIVNNKSHLEEIVNSNAELINTVILPIDSPNPLIRVAAFEVLSPFLLFTEADQGHPKMLAALDFFKYKKRENRRFETLVGTLKFEKNGASSRLFALRSRFFLRQRMMITFFLRVFESAKLVDAKFVEKFLTAVSSVWTDPLRVSRLRFLG